MLPYLWHEDETEGDCGAEDDEETDDEVGSVELVTDDEGNRDATHTHDDHVVHAHTWKNEWR